MCAAKNGNVLSGDPPVKAARARVFGDLEKGTEKVGVCRYDAGGDALGEICKRDEVCVGNERLRHGGEQFMTTDVVEHLLVAAVLIQSPGQEDIEVVSVHPELGGVIGVKFSRLGESVDNVGRLRGRAGGFEDKIEGTIRALPGAVIGGIRVLGKVIPAGHDEAAKAIDERIERAARCMLEHFQIAGHWVQAVGAGDGRRAFVFVELRIEVGLIAKRLIRHENDPVISRVGGRHVVKICGLIRHPDNRRNRVRVRDDRVEVRDFVKLPKESGCI